MKRYGTIIALALVLGGIFAVLTRPIRRSVNGKPSVALTGSSQESMFDREGRGFSFQSHDPKERKEQAKIFGGGVEERVVFYAREGANSNKVIKRTGFLVRRPDARATVLICHGYMCNKYDANILRLLFADYNVMTFDFRAHGDCCQGQTCSFGRDEAYDVIGAAHFIRAYPELSKKPLIVYGFSMGAVSSIIAQSMEPTLFDGAIWDCPYDSSNELLNRSIDKLQITIFGKQVALPGKEFLKKHAYNPYVQSFLKTILKAVARLDATKINTIVVPVSALDAIKKVTIPFLMITSDHDEKVPVEVVKSLYEAAGSLNKRLWITGGRKHFDSLFFAPEAYAYYVHRFIERTIKQIKK
ncbi:MAG: hypothetical protein UU47_C0010G0012 [candidate division TM6 bacterium GW2011_GWE2_41_16]|nr:MAG: hypothetical protein UU47_C0010G0012 [candidate division TM6 bacterium GW2011_GWE2_41_16]